MFHLKGAVPKMQRIILNHFFAPSFWAFQIPVIMMYAYLVDNPMPTTIGTLCLA